MVNYTIVRNYFKLNSAKIQHYFNNNEWFYKNIYSLV
jgi:hypothetical protein